MFAYLLDHECVSGACGGATTFHELLDSSGSPLRVYPQKGSAVMWSNRTVDGSLNPRTLHSGEPLLCKNAHKIGLNAWFRDEPWKA